MGRSRGPDPRAPELRPRLAVDALSAALPDDSGPARIVSIRGNARGDLLVEALADPAVTTRRHGNAFWLLTARGQLQPLLRSGQPAPELPDGILLDSGVWGENDYATRDRHSALTGRGEALVDFFLMGPGVDASNDRALYLVDRHGRAKLALRTGQRLEIAHGDVRTIAAYAVSWGRTGDEGRRPVNDARQVAARVIFTNGTSAIVRLEVPRAGAER